MGAKRCYVCFMAPNETGNSDKAIEVLEADIRKSQFSAWDVETFLAKRHQAKIDALEKPRGNWGRRWLVTKELGVYFLAAVGFMALNIAFGVWLVGGYVPTQ